MLDKQKTVKKTFQNRSSGAINTFSWYNLVKKSGEYFTGSNSFTSKTFTIDTDRTAFVIVFRAAESNKIATFSNFKLVKIYQYNFKMLINAKKLKK